HVASVADLEKGECVDAMERLRDSGKIRYWGISLFTFNPAPEAEWLMQRGLGDGFQLVLNIINQKSLPLLKRMKEKEYGIIARMPLQFGLLTGKFSTETKFSEDDHRKFRLTESIIRESENMLKPVWSIAEKYGMSKTDLALAFIFSHPEISTVIPGIRTANQAAENAKTSRHLTQLDMEAIHEMYAPVFEKLVDKMKTLG
ncbi:MAG: aldo/keto reductase, partial [Gemmatimonadaceae bacterium]|nr:aldo/keto reductase [Chitinophagaceae bacterium]